MKPGERILGVEGGGTKTAWVLVETLTGADVPGCEFRVIDQGKLPPSNFRLTTSERLRLILAELPKQIDVAGVFLAGCATEEDRRLLEQMCLEVWPNAKIVTGSDRDSGLAAALDHGDGIVVNAGSGSSVTGRRGDRIERAGGWGHILGDAGGGYFLSIQALRLILREHDLHQSEMQFTAKILHALSLNNFDELVRWVQTADKMDIAMLAPVVFEAATEGDARMMEIIEEGARVLCEYTEAVASRLHLLAPKVVLMGGLFYRDSLYTHTFRRRLKKNLPDARVATAARAPELGAAWLATEAGDHAAFHPKPSQSEIDILAAALTEQRNPRSENLEKMSAQELVEVFVEEEKLVQDALRNATAALVGAIQIVTGSLRNGGRLFYVGAGSSGRIGVLDASEIPPTFGAPPDLVQGVIAGGVTALYRSAEGAEDEESAGALALDERRIKGRDVVIGITASGRTPFVLGALARAKSLGAKTILLACNPDCSHRHVAGPTDSPQGRSYSDLDLLITLAVGPELLTGSTRLKAGTATKVALNIISTGAMIALGKVRGNLMIDLHATSTKLRDRAVRVLAELAQCDYESARNLLEANDWDLRAALEKL
ncbi:MAG: N-acetylmuramic acid 6-phosphate etherase [Verrucomicrobia bacterium]|nr:MAG: N-acetylmuramic acid 6-phosphate etherase [Verrucomicrobiota bacterium]PYL67580.1 MAG: N-acetylmuramic acid 6-phosphate etherase [Verrucomicrobiota bacterium]